MWTHVPFDAPPCIEAEWRHAALSVGALDDVIHVAQRLAPRWHPAADVPLLLSLLLLLLLLCGWRWRRARARLWWRHAALSVGALDGAKLLAPRWHPAADAPVMPNVPTPPASRGMTY